MKSLYAMTREELIRELRLEKPFQAVIIQGFLIKGVTDWAGMTSLPAATRERLQRERGDILTTKVLRKSESPSAVKLAVALSDGAVIECVRLSDGSNRLTACLSSQVGCAMGCSFCKTGTMGLVRDLTAGEICEELVHLEAIGGRISHIVFMGMGEPLANFQNLMDAVQVIHSKTGFDISYRKMTISTCGYVPGIRKLSELDIPIRLAVSLVSADDRIRSEIMRINRAYPLAELKKALVSFQHRQQRRLTLEYCMLSGVNTDKESAAKLASFTSGLDAVINLIPWNPVDGLPFKVPSSGEIRSFCQNLSRLGVHYTERMEKGRMIDGACGQLATETVSPQKP